ncbi:large ribosomal subunit protein mL63 [Culicoides brevitarsis]|uniref:large ribosomal subunit protein mL63 n=1 Tax=Culicoides brevitarsis TaxID=469753 RepID=UPI00307B905B
MRLTEFLLKRSVNGYIFRGKERLVKPVSRRSIETLHKEYQMQERNMLLLRHPYLTVEESHGHAKALGKKEKVFERWNKHNLVGKMKPHVVLEKRLGHLAVKDCWD